MGLGVDIVEIEQMRRALERAPRLAVRVFSQSERKFCDSHTNSTVQYALYFAAKEAVVRALGEGFSTGVKLTDIEIQRDEKGKPVAVLTGRAKEVAEAHSVSSIQLSLTRTAQSAVASVVAITPDMRPKPPKKKDPKEELLLAFKEARAMLDDDALKNAVVQMQLELDDEAPAEVNGASTEVNGAEATSAEAALAPTAAPKTSAPEAAPALETAPAPEAVPDDAHAAASPAPADSSAQE